MIFHLCTLFMLFKSSRSVSAFSSMRSPIHFFKSVFILLGVPFCRPPSLGCPTGRPLFFSFHVIYCFCTIIVLLFKISYLGSYVFKPMFRVRLQAVA